MLNFHCTNCGGNKVVSVTKGVTIYGHVVDIDSEGEISEAGCDHSDDGVMEYYMCASCGAHVADTTEELAEKFAVRLDRWCEACGLQEFDFDDLVHKLKGREASDINNDGLNNQIAYVLSTLDNDHCKFKQLVSEMNTITNADGQIVQCSKCQRWTFQATSTKTENGWICDYTGCQESGQE